MTAERTIPLDKKYEITWRTPQKTVLMIHYLAAPALEDVTQAQQDAFGMLDEVPHDVIVFHNGGEHKVDSTNLGRVHDSLYNKFPRRPPENLKQVIVLIEDDQIRESMSAAMEVLGQLFFKRKITQTVKTMAEAEEEELLLKAGV